MRKKNKIMPLFIPFQGCFNRCVYCNQNAITGIDSTEILNSVKKQKEEWCQRREGWTEVAFYGGSFGNLSAEMRQQLYSFAVPYPVRFSTCPDSIVPEIIREIEPYNIKTIELGIQSFSDKVLEMNGRTYPGKVAVNVLNVLKGKSERCAQMMVGMYGEDREDIFQSACMLEKTNPEFVRIYPTLVLKNTELENLFLSGKYEPLTPTESLMRSTWLYICAVAAGSRVIRMGLPADMNSRETVVSGWWHPAYGDLVKTLALYSCIINTVEKDLFITPEGYGYKGLLKDSYPVKFRLPHRLPVGTIRQAALRVKEYFNEGEQWFAERENIDFASRLCGTAYLR